MSFLNIHKELIDKCLEGDRKSQFEIYKLYYKPMYNTSLRILNDSAEAEDAMQEAFLSAFKKMNTYKGEVSFGAWLKKIVINQSIDSLRKKKVQFTELNTAVMQLSEDDNDSVDPDELTIQIQKVKDAIKALPDGYRIILSLYLIEGYDHDEIGQIMNITSSTSRSQFTRARQKLLQLLKN
jgi:RNA polymerase sigma factor (sigma-70 family)